MKTLLNILKFPYVEGDVYTYKSSKMFNYKIDKMYSYTDKIMICDTTCTRSGRRDFSYTIYLYLVNKVDS